MPEFLITLAQAASTTAAQTTTASGDAAPAQSQGNSMLLIGWIAVFGVMMFFMFRNQRKQARQRQEMLNQIKTGDRVVTAGGIYGNVTKVTDGSFEVEIADKVVIEVAKTGVTSVVNNGEAAKAAK